MSKLDEAEDLQDLLEELDANKQEKNKISRLLPNEIWQGVCGRCGSLAVRIFPPRKNLITIEKKLGIKGVMNSCQTNVKNQRILIDTPLFNLIITGHHGEVNGYDLSHSNHDCRRAVMITDNPRNLVWHLLTRLRAVKTACLINGISYNEFRTWFDGLDDMKAMLLIPGVITFDLINDSDNQLDSGPWYVAWIDTDRLYAISPILCSQDVNGDSSWDNCRDPRINEQLGVESIEYSSTQCGDHIIDAVSHALQAMYYGSGYYYGIVEPAGTPGRFIALKTAINRNNLVTNSLFSHMIHTIPTKYWMIESNRFHPGKRLPQTSNQMPELLDLSSR